ncbi:Calcium-binding EF-hand domain-containing protein [Mycena sanguinolenta]|uniref:Calcium-binding EF-hand domain-containing protein n=1 Tax=Mycena sanguinolenta TaxID=230812 RepID=A0A8H6XBD1_9AGAR|nr:Calcium-binding EF-hand domain-containing protein [Mycena sanguinolenta]
MSSKYPAQLSPSATLTKAQKSRARREPSGSVFSLFQAPQIQQFKEAFQLIDHDKDGWCPIAFDDRKGITPSAATLDELPSLHDQARPRHLHCQRKPADKVSPLFFKTLSRCFSKSLFLSSASPAHFAPSSVRKFDAQSILTF